MNKIKLKLANYILENKSKNVKRNKSAIVLSEAKNVGIIFNATSKSSFELVKSLIKQLKSEDTQFSTIGYINNKAIGEYYLYRKGFSFFTNKNLNWHYKPIEETILKFIDTEFDILINLSIYNDFPIQYIIGLSKAKMIIGKSGMYSKYLDLIIDMNKEEAHLQNLKKELKQKLDNKEISSEEYNNILHSKLADENILTLLIEQTIHYLSIVNKNFVNLSHSN